MIRTRPLTVVAMFLGLAVSATGRADVKFVGEVTLSGTGADQSGLPSTLLEDGHSPQNALNGIGSGMAYAGNNNYLLLADRGPNKIAYAGGSAFDNTTSWNARYQTLNIQFSPVPASLSGVLYTSYTGTVSNTATTLLSNSQGAQYVGISTVFSTTPGVENRRLDAESIRVAADGTTWVSDEYGPYILHFNSAGQQIGSLPVPNGFFVPTPGNNAAAEASATTGRVTNKGAEGLALTPDGKTLIVALQNALVQDNGGTSSATNSVNNRILVYNLTNPAAAPKQFLYQLDNKTMGISDLVALNNTQILVDERDGVAGAAGIKKLFLIDISQPTTTNLATSNEPGSTAANGLPNSNGPGLNLPGDITPLGKGLFADIGGILNANAATAFVNSPGLPDKIEGYAIGPDLADGRHLLLASNDNDFTQPGDTGYRPNYIFAFAYSDADVAAAAASVPEPSSVCLVGLTVIPLITRRNRRRSA